MITIDVESRERAVSSIDFDKMTERYKTRDGVFTFSSPSLWVIEKNLFYLLRESKEVPFNMKYAMRPAYLSYDEYGTPALAQLLMYINNVPCTEDFVLNTVVIPSLDAIVNIARDRIVSRDTEDFAIIDW